MKGYLKAADGGVFQLAPKVTTVGREGCDLTIEVPGVDYQHAVIEYSDQEQCFVLQDLNTSQGTYVNECRVQNAAVRLAPSDVIRFGVSSISYELEVESPEQVSYPPVHQRMAWASPLTVIREFNPNAGYSSDALPNLQAVIKSPPVWSQPSNTSMPPPRPPSSTMRTRPLSASSALARARPTDRVSQAGWVSGGNPARTILTNGTADVSIIQEKEQKIMGLQDEVRRLIIYESECTRKEELIQTLREEIADLQGRLRQLETARSAMSVGGSDAAVIHKLDSELQQKRVEVKSLKDQITHMKDSDPSAGPVTREDFNSRIMEVNSLRSELDRTKKDKNITSGLVTQMQRDMANKDTTISRLSRDLEKQKKEVTDKDAQLLTMQTKFKKVEDNRKIDEELDSKDKEMAVLKLKNKALENRVQEQSDLIKQLNSGIERMKDDAEKSRGSYKKLGTEIDSLRSNCLDLERTERQVRVDLQQASVKLERITDRIVQTIYATPGIKAPSEKLNDDAIIEALQKVVHERTDMYRQIKDLKESLQHHSTSKKSITDGSKILKQQLNETTSRLRQKGFHCSQVKQEIDLVSAVTLTEGLTWMRDMHVDLLKSMLAWQSDIEKALEECGINIKISNQGPAEHVAWLQQQSTDLLEAKERMEKMLETLRVSSQSEQEAAVKAVREELVNQNSDHVERIKLQSEEALNKQIDDIRTLAEERSKALIETEKSKNNELEVVVAQLKASIIEKEDENTEHRQTARTALEQLEASKKTEAEIKEKLYRLERQCQESVGKISAAEASVSDKYRTEVTNYQEQLRQHSVTICSLEERLNKILKKNKEYAAEVTQLKATVQELRTKPRPPSAPKPKLLIQKPAQDTDALEQIINQLRKENVDHKKQVTDQQTVITGLRRDLTGASAKLSDMTGELTEQQKEKMEKDRNVLLKKDVELIESRSNLAKLSSIIDKQKAEIKAVKEDLAKHKSAMSKLKNVVNEKESMVFTLEERIRLDQGEQKERLDTLQEEGRITSELSSLGAQCRGERHDQVITRQREALTELRMRIKALEQCNPAIPTHDQALQQVMLLKKDLAELRAKKAVAENKMIADTLVDRQIQRTHGASPSCVSQPTAAEQSSAEVERSAHRETMESLEYSENSYLTLLRSVSAAMDLEDVSGLRSMAHIPNDERQRLFSEREQSCEILASRIKVLQERISRKDELLQGYEKDLAKLRQAEMLADTRASQLEGLTGDVRNRTEEMQYLREALQRTRERLDQEKRLNAAIKAKKTFHMENEHPHTFKGKKPHCEQPDIFGTKDTKKKERTERAKRKDYEIKVLKTELSQREDDLTRARNSLMGPQSTGDFRGFRDFESSRDPFDTPM